MTRTLCLVALLLSACGSAIPEVAAPEIDRLAPTTLYPMHRGAQWVYDVDTGGAEPPTLGIFEVVEATGNTRQIANNRGMNSHGQVTHGDPMGYEILPEGIQNAGSGTWILRAPIELGAEWPAMGGRTARVVDLDRAVEVYAGAYEHCVQVEEAGGEDGRVVTTTYCPEVGPVVIESMMETRMTMRQVATRASLRSYDPG
ncbi:MAG TPA: hypothetical protein ENK57_10690 [Polyangiaceae bacterium]|nr:hypothetical protein [Polyangiaceae bacterium]